MMPPLGPNHRHDDTAAISEWRINSSFNNVLECIDSQAWMLQRAKGRHDKHAEDTWLSSACIASDDLLLREGIR